MLGSSGLVKFIELSITILKIYLVTMSRGVQELMDRAQSHVTGNTNFFQQLKPIVLPLKCKAAVHGSHRLSCGDRLQLRRRAAVHSSPSLSRGDPLQLRRRTAVHRSHRFRPTGIS